MSQPALDKLTLGFLPLTDCAVLVAARDRGFAQAQGLDLTLLREVSWATARDRLIFRQVQAAHLLGPLAVAVSLGIGQTQVALAAPIGLSLNGTQIVVSRAIGAALQLGPKHRVDDPAAAAAGLASVLRARGRQPVFGIVHRYSSHALILRYWLASAGIDPDRDVVLRVLPPSFMVEALAGGELDGFCAGEPWGSTAIGLGVGETIVLGTRIWRRGVEKVLAMRRDWMDDHPDIVDRLLRALDAAARWCDDSANHVELASLLSQPHYVDQPAALILRALNGTLLLRQEDSAVTVEDFLLFHRGAANFPWRSQALWIYAQFCRWGMLPRTDGAEHEAAAVFRPDIYRRALAGGPTPIPAASAKVEGALAAALDVGADSTRLTLGPDRFFDGRLFDPDRIEAYLAGFGTG